MERTEIQLHDEWKVVRIDSMNWQVFQLREIKESNKPGVKKRGGEIDWVALPAYFGTVAAAAGYVYDKLEDKAGKKNIKQLMDFMKREREKMVKAVEKVTA